MKILWKSLLGVAFCVGLAACGGSSGSPAPTPVERAAARNAPAARQAAPTKGADSLLGIHWYGKTDHLEMGAKTDVEQMTGGKAIWVTEITHVDKNAAPEWDRPESFVDHCRKVTAQGHSLLFRIQPHWSSNVPHPNDPFQLEDFAREAGKAAETLGEWVNVWQVGNEINIHDENRRWNPATRKYEGERWQPTPKQIADTYIAVRDAIHENDAAIRPRKHLVLMPPPSPGGAGEHRFMDGNEMWIRVLSEIDDPSKVDGFALHSYAEPGGTNYGVDGFMNVLREQLMIIDQFGYGDRPVFVTEFNKHMPDRENALIGAKFLTGAYQALDDWNRGPSALFPGMPNHNIVTATWFVYPGEKGQLWDDYSLQVWKDEIGSSNPEENVWYAFQHAATRMNLPAGEYGGGPAALGRDTLWFEDLFEGTQLDKESPLPHWTVESTAEGTATLEGGKLRLRGNGSDYGSASIRSTGYHFADFTYETEVTIVDSAPSLKSAPEANFEVRARETHTGYSLTFFSDQSPTYPNQIWLRRVNNWDENIQNLRYTVGGDGIATGDTYYIIMRFRGENISIAVYENDDEEPLVDWLLRDPNGQRVGAIRVGTYNLEELAVDYVAVSGPDF